MKSASLEEQSCSSKHVYSIVLLVNLLSMCGGMSLGWPSPILPKLTNPNRTDENPIGHIITESEESWITAMLMLGPLFATYPCGILADRIGRKWTLTLIGIPLLVSYILLAVARSVVLYLIARFAIGFSFGGTLSVLFVYVGEISDVKNRGKLLSFYNNFFTFGLLFSYVFGAYLSIMVFNLIAAVFPGLFLILFGFFGVESPVYLLKKEKRKEACEVLRRLRMGADKSVQSELEMFEREIKTSEEGTFKDVISDRVLIKGLTIAVALVLFQQLSGISAVLSFAESIFEDSGSSLPTEVSAIIVGVVQFVASFSTPILVDRVGRKILLLISATGMIVTQTATGAYFYISDNTDHNTDNIKWLPILFLNTFIIIFHSGFGVLPLAIMGEIFPSKVRSVAVATAGFINFLAAFTVSLLFKKMQGSIGNAGTFWIYGGFCILALVFVVVVVPETKGKSLEQIHKELRGHQPKRAVAL